MKNYLVIATIALLSTFQLPALEPVVEAAFIEKVQSAVETKNVDAMFLLAYLEGVEQSMKEMLRNQMSDIVNQTVHNISLVDPLPNQQFEYTRNGTVYRTNLPPIKMLRIEYIQTGPVIPGATSSPSVSLPVGIHDGDLFITTAAPVSN